MTGRREQGDEAHLLRPADGMFDPAELDGLPPAAATYLRSAIAPGTPLALSARIRMKGRIKIGRWVPFTAEEVLTPHDGFVWAARAAGIITGSDRIVDGSGAMDWKILGLVTVMHADGPDVSQSAAERAAAESVWVPTSLLPRFGVEWSALADGRIGAMVRTAGHEVDLGMSIDSRGMVRSTCFERWGDPDDTGEFSRHPFGGEFTAHASFDGITIPTEGRLGWHYGTDRWEEGEFFRYRITDLRLAT